MKNNPGMILLLRLGGVFFILAGLVLELWGMRHSMGVFRWVGPLLALSGFCDLLFAHYLNKKL